jgi:diguanylate cyclase (GGDEF)-like protein
MDDLHSYDPHEDALLAQAFRTLLDEEHFDVVLQQVAECAREQSGCKATMLIAVLDETTSPDTPSGPWCAGVDGPLDPAARASLTMPVVTDGIATHLLHFYKDVADARFTPKQVDAARKLAGVAGLVLWAVKLRTQIDRLSRIDDETGVLVRRGFEDDVIAALEEHNGCAGLFIVRVGDLEQINRRWGRDVGDEVLRHVARTMCEVIKSGGTVGRLRRHEFGAVLPGFDFADTQAHAAEVRELLKSPLPVLGRNDVDARIAIGAAAARGGTTSSIVPLLHATYKSLDADERARRHASNVSPFSR